MPYNGSPEHSNAITKAIKELEEKNFLLKKITADIKNALAANKVCFGEYKKISSISENLLYKYKNRTIVPKARKSSRVGWSQECAVFNFLESSEHHRTDAISHQATRDFPLSDLLVSLGNNFPSSSVFNLKELRLISGRYAMFRRNWIAEDDTFIRSIVDLEFTGNGFSYTEFQDFTSPVHEFSVRDEGVVLPFGNYFVGFIREGDDSSCMKLLAVSEIKPEPKNGWVPTVITGTLVAITKRKEHSINPFMMRRIQPEGANQERDEKSYSIRAAQLDNEALRFFAAKGHGACQIILKSMKVAEQKRESRSKA